MNEKLIAEKQAPTSFSNDDSNVLEIAVILAKNKNVILGVTTATLVVAGIVASLLPNVYESTTKILPPQQSQSNASALLSQLSGAAGLAAGISGLKNPIDLYVGILKSRTISDRLIERFDLAKVYGTSLRVKTRKRLQDNTVITSGKDGLITIDVDDENPERAAKLANAYVEQLFILTKEMAVTDAAQRRMFFEQQLKTAKDNLANAETALKKGLDNRGVISVDLESRGIAETIARLRAQISSKEIELDSMKSFVTEKNPVYKRVEQEIASLRGELSNLENGRHVGADSIASTRNGPEGLENVRLLRDVKYFQMLYELLAKQYEAARLDEARDPSIIQVLDPAVISERPLKPKRLFMVALATIFGVIFSMAFVFLKEAKNRYLLNPQKAGKWNEVKLHLRINSKNI